MTASISIDDFYLTAADQAKLTGENAGNTLLELRGSAGSHDLALGADSLNNLCSLTQKGTKSKIPAMISRLTMDVGTGQILVHSLKLKGH